MIQRLAWLVVFAYVSTTMEFRSAPDVGMWVMGNERVHLCLTSTSFSVGFNRLSMDSVDFRYECVKGANGNTTAHEWWIGIGPWKGGFFGAWSLENGWREFGFRKET
jgi:hypothetical protein